MSLQIDDMKVGQWVAITSETQADMSYSPFGFHPPVPSMVDGCPLKIVAICLPFIAVTNGYERFSLDCREYTFTKLDKKYVQCMSFGRKQWNSETGRSRILIEEQCTSPQVDPAEGLNNCPMCHEGRLRQRYSQGEWLIVCPVCGFSGGLPKSKGSV